MLQLKLLPGGLSDLFDQVVRSRRMTKADRYGLMAALLSDSLSEDEKDAIDRMLRSVRKGRILLVDEISAVNNYTPRWSGSDLYGQQSLYIC